MTDTMYPVTLRASVTFRSLSLIRFMQTDCHLFDWRRTSRNCGGHQGCCRWQCIACRNHLLPRLGAGYFRLNSPRSNVTRWKRWRSSEGEDSRGSWTSRTPRYFPGRTAGGGRTAHASVNRPDSTPRAMGPLPIWYRCPSSASRKSDVERSDCRPAFSSQDSAKRSHHPPAAAWARRR